MNFYVRLAKQQRAEKIASYCGENAIIRRLLFYDVDAMSSHGDINSEGVKGCAAVVSCREVKELFEY